MRAREVLRYLLFLGFAVASVFVPAGTIHWLNGWLFVGVMAAAVASVTFGIFRQSPDLAEERRTAAKHAKPWDRALTPIMSGLPVVTVVLAGLGHRFGWRSVFPPWTAAPAVALMSAGATLAYLAMRTNRFFSSYVRIQADRGHAVVDSGPYAWVRHPGYAGSIAVALAAPILLDSLPGFVLALVTTGATILRTYFEDQLLTQELSGYRAYRDRVRCRLLPPVW